MDATTHRRPQIRVALAKAADLVEGLRAVDETALLVVPCLLQLSPGAHVDVHLTFSDRTPAASLSGKVRWCHRAPLAARVPFLAGVALDAGSAPEVRRVAGVALNRQQNPRTHARRPASLVVSVSARGVSAAGRIADLSYGGARIVADLGRRLQQGEEIVVEFLDHRLRRFAHPFRAKVRWFDPTHLRGFGVQFEALDPLTTEAIAREVDRAAAA
jgi:hypothetical protein